LRPQRWPSRVRRRAILRRAPHHALWSDS
jgi:hypothetical protein